MQHVLQHRQAVDEIVILEDHAHLAAQLPQGTAVLGGDILAVQRDGAAADGNQGVDGAQQGGFARPRRPDDRNELPFLHGETDPLQGMYAVGIVLGHIVKL